jgi:hypothetical protein
VVKRLAYIIVVIGAVMWVCVIAVRSAPPVDPPQVILQNGNTPWPAREGALFLDLDASANGSIVVYANGAWRTIKDLP